MVRYEKERKFLFTDIPLPTPYTLEALPTYSLTSPIYSFFRCSFSDSFFHSKLGILALILRQLGLTASLLLLYNYWSNSVTLYSITGLNSKFMELGDTITFFTVFVWLKGDYRKEIEPFQSVE